ncbi:hypothetical protein AcW2_004197 [Taiwanofungus camphoratus]|nr:hypothetical protein AcW2_004197 [Antrodia cinnamomea]
MEIDMHALPDSFRATRSASGSTLTKTKRARSPTSAGPCERPTKRFSFGGDTSISVPLPRNPHIPLAEDWVAQTSGLRIASPLLAQAPVLGTVEEAGDVEHQFEERSRAAEDVVDSPMTDGDVSMTSSPPGTQRSSPPALPLPPSISQPQPHFLHPPGMLHFGQEPPQIPLPTIEMQAIPPSPVQEISASGSYAQLHALGHRGAVGGHGGRKQKFTMGPRADCEKCRMGVKGHWMHFD